MDHPLGVRLDAEALGTFVFFLGFSGVAVVVDIGADARGAGSPCRSRWSRIAALWCVRRLRSESGFAVQMSAKPASSSSE